MYARCWWHFLPTPQPPLCYPLCLQEWTGYYCIIHNPACHCVPLHYSSTALNPLVPSPAFLPVLVPWCRSSWIAEQIRRILLLSFKLLFSAATPGLEGGGGGSQHVESCHKPFFWSWKACAQTGIHISTCQPVVYLHMDLCVVSERKNVCVCVRVCHSRLMVVWHVSVLWL